MFYPAGLWEDLAEFLLDGSQDRAVSPESDGAGARGALIEGEDGLHDECKLRRALVFVRIIR
jgi:hypothetical protein